MLGVYGCRSHGSVQLWVQWLEKTPPVLGTLSGLGGRRHGVEREVRNGRVAKGYKEHTVDGRIPANPLRLLVYPIIYRVVYMPGRISPPKQVVFYENPREK